MMSPTAPWNVASFDSHWYGSCCSYLVLPRAFQDLNSSYRVHAQGHRQSGKRGKSKRNHHKNKEIKEVGGAGGSTTRSPLGTPDPGTQPNSRWIHRMPDRTIEF